MNIRPCFAEVDLNRLTSNYINIKKYTKKKVIGVVKANAYGHGAIEVSRALIATGVDMLAVATVEEALELRSAYKDVPILILGPVFEYQRELCIENSIALIASSVEDVKSISSIAKRISKNAIIHIAIDTGMGRVGFFSHSFSPKNVTELMRMLTYDNIIYDGIFTHFASADECDLSFTKKQYSIFKDIVRCLSKNGHVFSYIHSQNSAGIISLEDDICNTVRAGIALYGYYPSSEVAKILNIKPVLTWKCRISHIKKVPKDTPIGYGSTFKTESESIIATIPVGYADGLNRKLSNNYKVLVKDKFVPIIGRVCMDQTMIDVSCLLDCSVGDYVCLIGEFNDADAMANASETISYETLCAITSRVPRVYK